MKVFGIGHGRTGTRSLVSAMAVLGFDLLHTHNRIDFQALEEKDGGTDSAFAADFLNLDAMFPHSKFIYTTRTLDSWLDACKRKIPGKKPCKPGSSRYKVRVAMFGYDQGLGYKEDLLTDAFINHQSKVKNHFRHRPEALLELNIIEGEGWEILCPFLDVPIPDTPFPHRGKT